MQPDMWSGWGIRTLSAENPAYNPYSYHNGSVWPHDNAIIAMGFRRYGFVEEAASIAHDVCTAASYFMLHQVPELYAGIPRAPTNFPIQYLGANVPQAFAAGSTFAFLQMMLGFDPDAPSGRLFVDPVLPEWLPELTVLDLRVGKQNFDLRFWLDGKTTRWEVLRGHDKVIKQRTYLC
jgi:glycogen debranching enzyme